MDELADPHEPDDGAPALAEALTARDKDQLSLPGMDDRTLRPVSDQPITDPVAPANQTRAADPARRTPLLITLTRHQAAASKGPPELRYIPWVLMDCVVVIADWLGSDPPGGEAKRITRLRRVVIELTKVVIVALLAFAVVYWVGHLLFNIDEVLKDIKATIVGTLQATVQWITGQPTTVHYVSGGVTIGAGLFLTFNGMRHRRARTRSRLTEGQKPPWLRRGRRQD